MIDPEFSQERVPAGPRDDVDEAALGRVGLGGEGGVFDLDLFDDVRVDRREGGHVQGVRDVGAAEAERVRPDGGSGEREIAGGAVPDGNDPRDHPQDGRKVPGEGGVAQDVTVGDERGSRRPAVDRRGGVEARDLLLDLGGFEADVQGENPVGVDPEGVDVDRLETGHFDRQLIGPGREGNEGIIPRVGGDVVLDAEQGRGRDVDEGAGERETGLIRDPALDGARLPLRERPMTRRRER